MGSRIIGSLAAFLLILTSGRSWGFDCKKAYLPVDFVICSTPQVLEANEMHEKTWYETRSVLNEIQKADLLNDQRRWLHEFPSRCGVPTKGKAPAVITKNMQTCVQEALVERTNFLRKFPTTSIAKPLKEMPSVTSQPPAEQPPFEIEAGYEVQCGFANLGTYMPPLPDALVSLGVPIRREERFEVALAVSGRGGQYGGVDSSIFFSDDKLRQFLDKVRIATRLSCEKAVSTNAAGTFIPGNIEKLPKFYLISIKGTPFAACSLADCGYITAFSAGQSGQWTIVNNSIRPIIEQQRAQEQAQAAAIAQAQQQERDELRRKAELHKAVMGKFGLDRLTSLDNLQSNPFIMKGQTIAVLTSFDRMISESEALFLHYGFMSFPGLYVTGVPSTRFRSNEQIILFIRVIGLHEVKGAPVPTLPHGEYVDAYSCQQTDCNEMTLR